MMMTMMTMKIRQTVKGGWEGNERPNLRARIRDDGETSGVIVKAHPGDLLEGIEGGDELCKAEGKEGGEKLRLAFASLRINILSTVKLT